MIADDSERKFFNSPYIEQTFREIGFDFILFIIDACIYLLFAIFLLKKI